MFEVKLGRFLRPSVVIDFFAYFLPTLWCMNKVWVRKFPGCDKLDFAPELAISKGYDFLAFATAWWNSISDVHTNCYSFSFP